MGGSFRESHLLHDLSSIVGDDVQTPDGLHALLKPEGVVEASLGVPVVVKGAPGLLLPEPCALLLTEGEHHYLQLCFVQGRLLVCQTKTMLQSGQSSVETVEDEVRVASTLDGVGL